MSWLSSQLKTNYPEFTFTSGESFLWRPSEKTIYYDESGQSAELLHELAHALLSHVDYERDIDLIKLERDAWDLAAGKLAPKYKLTIDDDLIQDNLDSYRDWLHARSLCPNCSTVGYQIKQSVYNCLACATKWRVNEARVCGLRRYKISS